MAIIYTYPIKVTPTVSDLILISDTADVNNTKQVVVGSLPFTNNQGTVTSVGLSMPSAFAVANSPIIDNGILEVTTTGGSSGQFLAHDGTWATPTGGASNPAGAPGQLQYNLNGSSFGASPNMAIGGGAVPNVLSVTNIIQARGDSTNTGKFKVYSSDNSSHVSIEGPPTGGTDYSLKMPNAVGSADQVLKLPSTIGTTPYQLEWGSATGGGSPGGNNTEIQFNNNNAFDGSPNLTYNNSILTVGHTVSVLGQGTNNPASRIKLYDETNTYAVTLEGPTDFGALSDYSLKLPHTAPANNQILQWTTSGNLGWINTPSGSGSGSVTSVTSANAAITVATTTTTPVLTSVAYSGAANIGHVPTGGTGTTYLKGDGTWDTPSTSTNTNIANSQLNLDNNRTLDFYDGSTNVRSLTFIRTDGGSRNMFKFEADGGTAPTFIVGDTQSTYEGYVVIEGNGSSRTGQVQFKNAAGTNYTSIKAPLSFSANIPYTLPSAQGAASSVLTNNGSGTLSWSTASSVSSGAIVGTDLVLTNSDSSTVSIDASTLINPVGMVSGNSQWYISYGSNADDPVGVSTTTSAVNTQGPYYWGEELYRGFEYNFNMTTDRQFRMGIWSGAQVATGYNTGQTTLSNWSTVFTFLDGTGKFTNSTNTEVQDYNSGSDYAVANNSPLSLRFLSDGHLELVDRSGGNEFTIGKTIIPLSVNSFKVQFGAWSNATFPNGSVTNTTFAWEVVHDFDLSEDGVKDGVETSTVLKSGVSISPGEQININLNAVGEGDYFGTDYTNSSSGVTNAEYQLTNIFQYRTDEAIVGPDYNFNTSSADYVFLLPFHAWRRIGSNNPQGTISVRYYSDNSIQIWSEVENELIATAQSNGSGSPIHLFHGLAGGRTYAQIPVISKSNIAGAPSGANSSGMVVDLAIKISDFSIAVSTDFNAYLVNTTNGTITATLPASPNNGQRIKIIDIGGNLSTNNLTINRNSNTIQGNSSDLIVSTNRDTVELLFVSTYGWVLTET